MQAWKSSQYLQEGRAAGVRTGRHPPSRGGGPPLGPAAPSPAAEPAGHAWKGGWAGGEEQLGEDSGSPPFPTPPSAPALSGCCNNRSAGSLAEGSLPDGRRGPVSPGCQSQPRGLRAHPGGFSSPVEAGWEDGGGKSILSGAAGRNPREGFPGAGKGPYCGKSSRRKRRRRKREHLPLLCASHRPAAGQRERPLIRSQGSIGREEIPLPRIISSY